MNLRPPGYEPPRLGTRVPPCSSETQAPSQIGGRHRREDPLAELTSREQEVLSLVAEGLSNKGIAHRLFITERTVEAHVKQIFLKLHLAVDPESHRRVLAVLAQLRATTY